MKRHLLFIAALALLAPLAFAQSGEVIRLNRVVVLAGRLPTGERPGSVLNSLEVVMTPGAAADINRALQTLPGVQMHDEGNALFVRGGDSIETATLVNGLRYPAATRFNAPAGNFVGTLNPFEARSISFSSGGFGARFGNALSGIVEIDTLGAPPVHSLTVGVGLGALSLGAEAAFNEHTGLRLMATRMDIAPMFRLSGATRDYPDPPNGHDISATAAWEYRPGAELKVFAVEQAQRLGLIVNLPTQRGLFRHSSLNRLATLSWKDSFGAWSSELNAGGGTLERRETVGTIDLETITQHRQFAGRVAFDASERLQFSAGFDGAREHTTLAKLVPPSGAFAGGIFSNELPGTRWGVFGETDAVPAPHVRAIAGVRVDHSSLTQRTTVDPRLSLAWEPRKAVSLSLAGGVYHQIPEAYHFFADTGRVTLPPMRANQLLAGLQLGRGDKLARLEIYTKDYAGLVALNRAFRPVAGGTGRADGLDVFLKSPLPWAMNGRLTYSYVDTRRTDPDSGRMARAPFDVTHTASLIVERAFGDWVAGAAWRFASGRPFTPITGGAPNVLGGFDPIYGAPFSERLPSLLRLDLSASRYRRVNDRVGLVLYVAVSNVLNRRNVYAYEYSDDFASRSPTPSIFGRGVYFGFSLIFS